MEQQEQRDVASLIVRLYQMDSETHKSMKHVHWLWERIMRQDIPRLRKYLKDPEIQRLMEIAVEELQFNER